MEKYGPIPIDDIREAQKRISDSVLRTPLVKLNIDDAPADIYLKLENLQPIGAFKIRGARNAILTANKEELKNGVWTVSSGNHGKAVAWNAQQLGLKCTVHAWDVAAKTKLDAIRKMGATVKMLSMPSNPKEMKKTFYRDYYPDEIGVFIHPFSDPAVMAGQGTIGLEILDDLPDVDAVLMPWGGGGLSCGIASAIKELKPDTRLYGCETDMIPSLSSSFAAGKPTDVKYKPNFISGIGVPFVLTEMWERAKVLLDGALTASMRELCDSVQIMAEKNKIVAEGASAVSVAAALAGKAGKGKIVCIVSGGNIDIDNLVKILQGQIP
jgi:threonine dehydratase